MSEKFIQKEITKKLNELQKETAQSLDKSLSSKLENEDSTPEVTSTKLNEKLQHLSEKLNQINSSKYFQDRISKETNKEIAGARSEVIACLRSNSDKPLNCWEEVQKFRNLVKDL